MHITAIKQQQRLKSRYSIYIDDTYAFSFSADVLLNEKIVVGLEINEQQLKAYKKLSDDDKAYGLAQAYVIRRMRSEWELTQYFLRKGYDEALSQVLLEKLKRLRMIDDDAFAEAWVRNRRLLKQVSKRRLLRELQQKHVAGEVIERVLREDETDEVVVLQDLITRKRRQSRYQDSTKLMQYLAQQGFTYDAIKAALADSEG